MDELIPLNDANLARIGAHVPVPTYDRTALTAGIVHIGLGNFHRAHQAWYLHRLMQDGGAKDWAIIGAGVRANDAAMRDRLLAQDGLTTLIELDPTGKSAEVCGAMIGFVPVEDGNSALIAQMAAPNIRIVALTVTEGGYFIDPATGGFDANHPDIAHDAANPDRPHTAFGAMIQALKLRRDAGLPAFTCQSCDNLQGNGAVLRQTLISLANLTDPDLADWIATHSSFPNSMVDCIVPATGPTEIALAREFGIDDAAPVTHENFRQWVIEDNFCAGRPDWDKAGATFTKDVHDFEAMKIRILNGGHQVIAYPGEILGLATIAQTMAHTKIRALFRKVIADEVAPHVAPVPGFQALEYLELIDRRFSNPEIADTTRRVAFDGSSRQPGFIVPSIRDGLAAGTPIDGLALVTAAWARYCVGTREDGSEVAPNDPNWDTLNTTAKAAQNDPTAWLALTQYYGDLGQNATFANAFATGLARINQDGMEAAITAYLNG